MAGNYFRHPSTVLICGPTKCGKTFFITRALREKMFQPEADRLIWAFGIWQPGYEKLVIDNPNIEFVKGLDGLNEVKFSKQKRNLLVLDDLMSEGGQSPLLTHLFTRGSHHHNLTVVHLVQNLFHRGKTQRDCSLNSHYIVLFDNPRDRNQISILGRQMFPDQLGGKFLRYSLADACKQQHHGYLTLDLNTDTPDESRVRTAIFPGEDTIVYKPN